jgi:hypothetical protein
MTMLRTTIVAFTLLLSTIANGQGTLFRAYLSSAGNDANPCTLASPCRLLPAALTAVLNNGEIWMLDSANYNTATVNIGKSVSILAVPGAVGSVLALGGPAITITASGLSVTLRNLVIVPLTGGGGTHGVHVTGASQLIIEKSVIAGHANDGILVDGSGKVQVTDSEIRKNGYGVYLTNGATAEIASVRLLANDYAIIALGNNGTFTTVSVSDSIIANSAGMAVWADSVTGGGLARAFVTRCTIHNNNTALEAEGQNGGIAVVAVSNTMVVNNLYAWYVTGPGATIRSFGNNPMSDNSSSLGSLTTTPAL